MLNKLYWFVVRLIPYIALYSLMLASNDVELATSYCIGCLASYYVGVVVGMK